MMDATGCTIADASRYVTGPGFAEAFACWGEHPQECGRLTLSVGITVVFHARRIGFCCIPEKGANVDLPDSDNKAELNGNDRIQSFDLIPF
jgi:hypothetical protein